MHWRSDDHTARAGARAPHIRDTYYSYTAASESTLPFTRRSELIKTIYAAGGLMGNDHILSLPTRDALVQRGAPALGRRIYVPGRRRAFRIGGGRSGVRCTR